MRSMVWDCRLHCFFLLSYDIEGKNWVRTLTMNGSLFCGPLFLTFCFLNAVAIANNSTAALPFGPIDVIFLTLVTSPLLVLDGIAGKYSKALVSPCCTSRYPREIPRLPWYLRALAQLALAGFVPFSAIYHYIELDYMFSSVWGPQIHTVYDNLYNMFIILLIVTTCSAVALTYLQLAVEHHEWWWRAVPCHILYSSIRI